MATRISAGKGRRIKALNRNNHTNYTLVLATDGTYAVEVTPRTGRPLTISEFAKAEEARHWIDNEPK